MKSALFSALKTPWVRVLAIVISASALSLGGFFVATRAHANPTTVVINEFSSASSPDWVELYNPTASAVDVNGWVIQDRTFSGTTPSGYSTTTIATSKTIPANTSTSIPAGGFLVINEGTHLNAGGDIITLLDASNTQVDQVVYGTVTGYTQAVGAPTATQSAGRATDGGTPWQIFSNPTPGYTNVDPNSYAPGSTITITNDAELCDAVQHQADGQTWNIAAGNYAVSQSCGAGIMAGGVQNSAQTGWYFPIIANNLTINGAGDGWLPGIGFNNANPNTTLYGTGFTQNGDWATQDLIAIFGNNVTLNGLTIMDKVEPNKAIEVIGANSTIENVHIAHNTLTDPSEFNQTMSSGTTKEDAEQWNGSIYYNDATGTNTLSLVQIDNGGISIHAPNATIDMTNVWLTYASNIDWLNNYRINVASVAKINDPWPQTITYNYNVDNKLNNLQSAVSAIGNPGKFIANDFLGFLSDATTTQEITLAHPVTIWGNGYTIRPTFANTGTSNNAVIGIETGDATTTINSLNIDGTYGTKLHGINIYESSKVTLNDVTSVHNAHNGIVVNGSEVTASNLTTAHNGWGGVDVDQGSGVTTPAVFTVTKTSNQDEGPLPDIYVDDTTKNVTVNDVDHQYSYVDHVKLSNDRVYKLIPAAPTDLSWKDANSKVIADNGYTNLDSGTASWSDSFAGVDHYVYKYWNDIATSPYNGEAHAWETTTKSATLAGSFTEGEGVHHFEVSACNVLGGCSAFSDPFTITYDKTVPTTAITSASQDSLNDVTFTGTVSDPNLNYYYCYLTTNQTITVGTSTYTPGEEVGTRNSNCETTWAKGQTTITGTLGGFDVSNLPSGSYTVNLVGYDLAGNNNASTPATKIVTIDHSGPLAPVIDAPADNSSFTTQPTIKWHIPGGAPSDLNHYLVWFQYAGGHQVANGDLTDEWQCNGTPNCVRIDSTSSMGSYKPTDPQNGIIGILVRAVDNLGNLSSWGGIVPGTTTPVTYTFTSPVPPAVTTDTATNVTSIDATLNGTVGPTAASQVSFWVSTSSSFDISSPNIPKGVYSTPVSNNIGANTKFSDALSLVTTNGIATGGAQVNMPAITPNTMYYYVAWAYVNGTWKHGVINSVETNPAQPSVTTDSATNVMQTAAILNGTNGPVNADSTSFWWGTTMPSQPIVSNTQFSSLTGWKHDNGLASTTSGSSFTENITGLTANTTYYYIAWVHVGSTWYPGAIKSFTTAAPVPSVTTDAATNISLTDATLNGTNGPVVGNAYSFWVSTSTFTASSASTTIPANVYSSIPGSTVGIGGSISASLSALTQPNGAYVHGQTLGQMPAITQGTTYYYVAWVNVGSTWYPGAVQHFTTKAEATTAATITVMPADLATSTSALAANPTSWFFWNDDTNAIDNTLGSFVTGPGTAPLGTGSAQISAPAGSRIALATGAFKGIPLSEVAGLSYATYRSVGTSDLDLALQFDINPTGTTPPNTYEGRLVFEPYLTGAAVANNTWQTWNPETQKGWWFSHGDLQNASNCKMSSPCTLAQVLAAYPHIGISGGTYFKAGQWIGSDFTGNVDAFALTTNDGTTISTTTFDFEPTPGGGAGGPNLGTGNTGLIGDLNHDGHVNFLDFAILIADMGEHGTNLVADLNHDGAVDLADLAILLANWTN